jgi:hypothetical protein
MAKYKMLIVFQLLMISETYGQSGTFNMAKSLPYPLGYVFHMIVYEDTIVSYGVGFNNNIEWKQGNFVAKFDTLGNLLAHNFILDTKGDLLNTNNAWGNIIRTADGGFAAIAATVYRKSAFLIKMANDLHVEFIKEYPDTVNLSNFFYKLLETPEGYLLYGSIQRPDFYTDGFIRHVDKQGETIWIKNFDFSQFSTTVVNVQKKMDSTYIASFVSTTSILENTGFSTFMVLGINGDELGLWQFPVESVVGGNRKIIVTNEGEILAYGIFKIGIVGSTPQYQSTLLKFDDQLMPVWVSHFGRIGSLNASILLWDFAPAIDGHYIGAGETLVKDGNDPTRRTGWLYKFSTDGDSIWERKINAPFLPLYYTNSGFFAGVGVLGSGNIIAGGSTNEGNTQYCWLVKVTNDGCLDTLFCQPATAVTQPQNRQWQELDIYPIPASSGFNITYSTEIIQVSLLDTQGNLLLKQQNSGKTASIDLPTSLPNGFYFAEIQDKNGYSIRKKICVVK